MDPHTHWNDIYTRKQEDEVSWFEAFPAISLRLLEAAGLNEETCVIDVGGGDSHLIDHLTARGLDCLAVLDVSAAALQRARTRLGSKAGVPIWIESDVVGHWSLKPMDIWHDRAVFHFLTDPEDRGRYLNHLRLTLKSEGAVIIATFALDGPDSCSGLPVMRYSPELLTHTLGSDFELMESIGHVHHTPWGTPQAFQYSRLKRVA